jgi:hypothetical protein
MSSADAPRWILPPVVVLAWLAICPAAEAPPGSGDPAPGPVVTDGAAATTDAAALAKQLSNPISSLISLPFQFNYDGTWGDDGHRLILNIQPVYPATLSPDWNLISRTIIPLVYQDDVLGDQDQMGLGDTLQSLFFSPRQAVDGWTWGLGPAALLPTASEDELGAEQWALGPTGVALRQVGPWTYGLLANHLWTVTGDDERRDVESTFPQPFVAFTTPAAVTMVVNTESTYDWEAEAWSVPINLQLSRVTRIGSQPISLQGGLRWWAEVPEGGPEWGARFTLTLLYPR